MVEDNLDINTLSVREISNLAIIFDLSIDELIVTLKYRDELPTYKNEYIVTKETETFTINKDDTLTSNFDVGCKGTNEYEFNSLIATHNNNYKLDLEKLFNFDDFNLCHDMWGIISNMNGDTAKLEKCFIPRSVR